MDQWRAKKIERFILEREKQFTGFGSVCKSYVQCGKPNCRCAKGEKHGPYYYLSWRQKGKVKRFYLGGPEEAEVARQVLLVIRRKVWRGYNHCWLYRRSMIRGLVYGRALDRFMDMPTLENFRRAIQLYEELLQIDAGQLHGTTKRTPRRKDFEAQDGAEGTKPEDEERIRLLLEAYAKELWRYF